MVKVLMLMVLMVGGSAQAARLKAFCTAVNGKVEGTAINKKVEIASLSKIMTSYWAAATLDLQSRFETSIHVTEVAKDLYDVHVQGSKDPFFSQFQFQFLISELNQMHVFAIRHLTFDENFWFRPDARSREAVIRYPETPTLGEVLLNLKSEMKQLDEGYDVLRKKALEYSGLTLVPQLKLKVTDINALSTANFQKQESTKTWILRSAPLYKILHDINRSSNNYASHLVFESLGGATAFSQFILEKLALGPEQVEMYEGSGYPKEIQGKKYYNKASCVSVISIIGGLISEVEKQGLVIQDILSVAGLDISEDERSTVSAVYTNEVTTGALIAKTGTANPVVALAGEVSTQKGKILFASMYGTSGGNDVAIRDDQREGRKRIITQVTDLIKKNGGAAPISFTPYFFFPIDEQSRLTEANNDLAKN